MMNKAIIAVAFLSGLAVGFIISQRIMRRKKGTLSENDITNVVKGITNSNDLENIYRKLINKVHPDKNQEKIELANEYTLLLNKYRKNFAKLKELEIQINSNF